MALQRQHDMLFHALRLRQHRPLPGDCFVVLSSSCSEHIGHAVIARSAIARRSNLAVGERSAISRLDYLMQEWEIASLTLLRNLSTEGHIVRLEQTERTRMRVAVADRLGRCGYLDHLSPQLGGPLLQTRNVPLLGRPLERHRAHIVKGRPMLQQIVDGARDLVS